MVEVVSIVISVISFVGALLSASITGWFAYFSEERKRRSESEKLIAKYRDPLLLASTDLQSRLFNILELGFLGSYNVLSAFKDNKDNDDESSVSEDHTDNVLRYTCFLVGQYFSWTYILRRQVQFLRFSTSKDNKELVSILDKIQDAFSTDKHGNASVPFLLWRGQQMAIGEIMTVKDDTDLFCMGYAAFTRKWKDSREFRGWFYSIETSIKAITHASFQSTSIIPDHRLRRLQHLFLDLIDILDPRKLRVEGSALSRCPAAPECACLRCSGWQGNSSPKY
jgi:hypothetical protein